MKIQDYYHEEFISMANNRFSFPFEKMSFAYIPSKRSKGAALNFHLTTKEKINIYESIYAPANSNLFNRLNKHYRLGVVDIDPAGPMISTSTSGIQLHHP
jgi:hypothetical protein